MNALSLVDLILSSFEALEGNNQRKLQLVVAVVGTLATIGMWYAHLSDPSRFNSLSSTQRVLVLVPPFITVFGIGHFVFPNVSAPADDPSGPMSGYLSLDKSDRKWRIVVGAGFISAINFLLMMLISQPL